MKYEKDVEEIYHGLS